MKPLILRRPRALLSDGRLWNNIMRKGNTGFTLIVVNLKVSRALATQGMLKIVVHCGDHELWATQVSRN
jgi:hypothetical protein